MSAAVEVKCWCCGRKARRKPDGEPVPVVGQRRLVQPHGICGAKLSWGGRCTEPLLTIEDARFVLQSAIRWDNQGGNSRSEFDL